MKENIINKQDIHLKIPNQNTSLYVARIFADNQMPKTPMILIHGSMENGRIFYSKSLKGLAAYFANHNYDVFVIDLRGKGQSFPIASTSFDCTHFEVVSDLDFLYKHVKTLYPKTKQVWAAHSWGGVYLNCYFIRNSNFLNDVSNIFYFACKRSINIWSLKKIFMINFGFNLVLNIKSKLYGNSKNKFFGLDGEAKTLHRDIVNWIKPSKFVDPYDDFDYSKESEKIKWPKLLFLAAKKDDVLGTEKDILYFAHECNQHDYEFWMLSKDAGNLHDYDHNSMITHVDAYRDHFPKILAWLKEN